jgi:hypothetical protein
MDFDAIFRNSALNVALSLCNEFACDPRFWREVNHEMTRQGYGLRLADNKALAETELRVIRL